MHDHAPECGELVRVRGAAIGSGALAGFDLLGRRSGRLTMTTIDRVAHGGAGHQELGGARHDRPHVIGADRDRSACTPKGHRPRHELVRSGTSGHERDDLLGVHRPPVRVEDRERDPLSRPPREVWWHRKEAARLDFSVFADHAQPSAEPVILGIIDLPATGGMQITVRSFHRAVLAARFFGRRLGDRVTLVRLRVLNRLLTAADISCGVESVDDLLDHDVTVVDPRAVEAEQAWDDAVARRRPVGVRSLAAVESIAEELMNREVADVPMVEDLPLHPEEETPSYSHLETTLHLRLVRALEHSRGRTDVTLRRIIRDMVDRAAAGTRRDGDVSDLYRVEP